MQNTCFVAAKGRPQNVTVQRQLAGCSQVAALQAVLHCRGASAQQLQATTQRQRQTLHSPALQIELHCVEDAIQELQMARSRDSAEAAAQLQATQEAALQRLQAASLRSSSVLQRAVSMQQQRPQVQVQLHFSAWTALLSHGVHAFL